MISKYFLLVFICFSLAQVQGNELEKEIKKGLLKIDALYNRAAQRVDNADKYQSQLIQVKAADFMKKIQKMRETSKQTLRRVAAVIEEKAKEMGKADSVFECISKAENDASNQIQGFTSKFEGDMEMLQKMYSRRVQTAAKPLAAYRVDLPMKNEKANTQIKACKNIRCVEIAVNNYSIYIENIFESVKRIETQINTIVYSFQREVTVSFNNVNRQVNRVLSDGLRQIRGCVYKRDVFDEEQ